MASQKSPPEFVESVSWLTLLSPEDIRLAKRNTETPSLVHSLPSFLPNPHLPLQQILSLDKCLLRLLEAPPESDSRYIDIVLRRYGYPRHWSSSVRERLYAISFLVLMRNLWGKKLALRISEHSASSLPNLSGLWSRHLFPLSPKPPLGRVTPSRSHLTRDTCVQSYGRITQKVKLLKNLERCQANLVSKIMKKLSLLHAKEGSQSPSKRLPIPPDLQLLHHCQGFVMSQSMRGSTQEGSLRKLREEAAVAEEMSQNSLKLQSHLVKYFDWIGAVDAPPLEATQPSASTADIEERNFHEELTKSADMAASLESVIPTLLLHGKYSFLPSSSTTCGEEPQRRSRVVSSEICLHELALIANSQLEDLSITPSNDFSDPCSPEKGKEKEGSDKSPPLHCPSSEQDKFLELSLASLLSPMPHQSPSNAPEGDFLHVLEARTDGGVGEALSRLRENHQSVLRKTVSATQKYHCPYEFGSLPRGEPRRERREERAEN